MSKKMGNISNLILRHTTLWIESKIYHKISKMSIFLCLITINILMVFNISFNLVKITNFQVNFCRIFNLMLLEIMLIKVLS